MYETLHRLGIKTKIRRGLSHFWNVIYLKVKEITFDVTNGHSKEYRFIIYIEEIYILGAFLYKSF